eukprot:m.206970 g.206970  ORF g.206970 m.206970 type:complete len:442 (+) comp23528_c0_seq1:100-1425(+)
MPTLSSTHWVVRAAMRWQGVVAPALATFLLSVLLGVAARHVAMHWHPLQRRVHRRSAGQQAVLGVLFMLAAVGPVVIVWVLSRVMLPVGSWCTPSGAALAFFLWVPAVLKAFELVFGLTEPGALHDNDIWLLYFCAPTEPVIVDGSAEQRRPDTDRQRFGLALARIACSGALLRWLAGYAVAMPREARRGYGGTLAVGTTWCCLLTHVLSISQAVLVDVDVVPCGGMQWPMELSHSPGEFWGDRMDIAVNRVLRRAVYLPVRRQFGKDAGTVGRTAGVTATFLVSGLLHEVLWLMVWIGSNQTYPSEVGWVPGATTTYFLLQCLFCVAASMVPSPVKSAVGRLPGPILVYLTLFGSVAVGLRLYLGPIYLDTHPEFIEALAALYGSPRTADQWQWLTDTVPAYVIAGPIAIPREFVLHGTAVLLVHARHYPSLSFCSSLIL